MVAGSNMDGTRVNKVEIIRYVIDELGIKNQKEIVMIGDRKHDVIGALNNNVDSIGVLYGYGSLAELKTVSPTYIIDSVSGLYALLIKREEVYS